MLLDDCDFPFRTFVSFNPDLMVLFRKSHKTLPALVLVKLNGLEWVRWGTAEGERKLNVAVGNEIKDLSMKSSRIQSKA